MCQHFHLIRFYYDFCIFHHIPPLISRNIHSHFALIFFAWVKKKKNPTWIKQKNYNGQLWKNQIAFKSANTTKKPSHL